MREIKFRGLRTDGKGWVYGIPLKTKFGCDYIITENGMESINFIFSKLTVNKLSGAISVIPESVGQFTGLKDKNGNYIYEGDVLHSNVYHKTWIADFTPCDGLKLAIKYEDDFKIEGIVQTHEDWRYNKVSTCEITGNIHEQK